MSNRSDNFDRANSTTSLGTPSDGGSAWVARNGTWGINTNRGYKVASDVTAQTAVLDVASAVVTCQVTQTSLGNMGLVFRESGASNFMLFQFTGNNLYVWKCVAGTYTQLGSTISATIAGGDVFKVDVTSGNVITTYHNGTSKHNITDSTHSTNTNCGFWVYETAVRFDDYSVTDNASGSVSVTPGVGSVAISGFAPSIAQPQALAPAVGSISLQGFAPTVSQSAGAAVAPGVGALSLSGFAPSIEQPIAVSAGVVALTLTGFAPDVQQASGILPGTGSVALAGFSPSIAQTANQDAQPSVGAITMTGFPPDVAQSGQPQAPAGGLIFGGLPRRKRYVVEDGRRVMVFSTEDAASAAKAAIDKARTIRATAPQAPSSASRRRIKRTARAAVASALAAHPPVETFTTDELQQLAGVYQASNTLAALQRIRDLEQMAALWQTLRDEADDEAALLELL